MVPRIQLMYQAIFKEGQKEIIVLPKKTVDESRLFHIIPSMGIYKTNRQRIVALFNKTNIYGTWNFQIDPTMSHGYFSWILVF